MKIFSFTGWSGSGKTTLISNLIHELSTRGHKVLAVKKVPEKYHIEPEGKDSRKFLESGAETVYLVADKQLMKMISIDRAEDLFKFAEEDLKLHDFVLIEGKITSDCIVFEVYDPDVSDELKTDKKLLNAVISDHRIFKDIQHFRRDEIGKIADLMESIK